MKGIAELVVAISVLIGGGRYTADYLLKGMKRAAAEKINEQGKANLGSLTRTMTRKSKPQKLMI